MYAVRYANANSTLRGYAASFMPWHGQRALPILRDLYPFPSPLLAHHHFKLLLPALMIALGNLDDRREPNQSIN